jgi:hypothetical protein
MARVLSSAVDFNSLNILRAFALATIVGSSPIDRKR